MEKKEQDNLSESSQAGAEGSSQSGSANPENAPDDKTEIEKVQRALADYKDKYVRLFAEFENTRKRFERDRLEFIKYANEEIITEFLSILDDLKRSIEVATVKHQDYDSFVKGIEMVMARVYDLLKKNNVRPIDAVGRKFDPHCHEVLMQEETDQQEDGTVMEEFQKGYYLGDRVIRTSKVKVAVQSGSSEKKNQG